MGTFFCSHCGHATDQAKETEAGVFCPQCGWLMELEDFREENVQQQITSSLPVTVEAASFPKELKRDPIKFNTVSVAIDQNIRERNMSFKPGDRVQYDGQDTDRLGLKSGMEGEVVHCFKQGVDVYFSDLRRVVHLMDFHMRTSLKRMLPKSTATKEEKRSGTRRIRKLVGLIAFVILIIAIIIFILKFKYPEILQEKYFLRYFRMR